MKRILYLTDNSLDKRLHERCMETLAVAAVDIPILSVSQGPCDLGQNINVGDIGRSWLSLYRQQVIGLEQFSEGDTVFIAEHDILYHPSHFAFDLPSRDKFYYNENVWLCEGTDRKGLLGMYSRWPRRRLALSQMVADCDLYLRLMRDRLALIDGGLETAKRFGDPGSTPADIKLLAQRAVSGCGYLKPILDRYLDEYQADVFWSDEANVDIRHGSNFTGPRRGRKRTFSVPYWGAFIPACTSTCTAP